MKTTNGLIGMMVVLVCVAPARGDQISFHEPGWVSGLAFDTLGRRLATACSDGNARLHELDSAKTVVLSGHSNCVVAVACRSYPDTNELTRGSQELIATGSYDQTARLWDADSGKAIAVLGGHRGAVMTVAFSPIKKLLATGSIDGTIRLWNAASGELLHTFTGHKSWVNSVQFSRNGSELISGSSDGTIKIWNMKSRRLAKTIDATKSEVRSIAIPSIGFSVAGNVPTLAAGLRYGDVKVWRKNRQTLNFKAHESDVWAVAFDANGELFVTVDGDWGKPGQIKFWNADTGALVKTLAHTSEVLSLAVSRDSPWSLAAGGSDGHVMVWTSSQAKNR
jgi:WD40 repeat protein